MFYRFSLALLLLLGVCNARAAMVSEFVTLDLQATTSEYAGGFGNGFNETDAVLNPFNSALGQLDRVNVSITGSVTHLVSAGQHSDAYLLETETFLGFEGLDDYFILAPDLSGVQNFQATGAGDTLVGGADFTIVFQIDAASEGLGDGRAPDFVAYSTGLGDEPGVSGERDDFLDINTGSELMLIVLDVEFSVLGLPDVTQASSIQTMLSGTMQVDYHYTPLSAVPVPAAVWLFATGFLGLAGGCRRRRTS